MITGRTWIFNNKPSIASSAVVGGPFEAQGPLADDFDILNDDLWLGEDSYEKAEKKMVEQACDRALAKAELSKEEVQFFLAGDLMNQIISSSFAARTLATPYLGIFGACSTSMEGLALASLIVDAGFANTVMAATSSHNATAEKQYRYPTEYGSQKPPTAQWTVTGSGAVIVTDKKHDICVTTATIGKIIDMGIQDPFNMGAAMAPAAVDTIEAHFHDLSLTPDAYDLVLTGDLGKVGHRTATDLLEKKGLVFPKGRFGDCGLMIYSKDQPVFSGASGCASSACVTYGHILRQLRKGALHKVLIIATGALLSPISYQQKESIPCVAHAVSIEKRGGKTS
ncbi:stage V sporulation protein AD [Mechercharimyces sp. CAU 1602]|uniref:stage V sporulation protein AD n=1 Tax=Mechercharimyces sp. CAU 1602 TaxID=2973933 RepID=UPI002161C73E|nr:stage V sporulation protein AD [Mechercharimyces sp. CAU 1602]MCS1350150.1 stage V sporulation protein AD [Mechercharimyces sp. CAU 1602]